MDTTADNWDAHSVTSARVEICASTTTAPGPMPFSSVKPDDTTWSLMARVSNWTFSAILMITVPLLSLSSTEWADHRRRHRAKRVIHFNVTAADIQAALRRGRTFTISSWLTTRRQFGCR